MKTCSFLVISLVSLSNFTVAQETKRDSMFFFLHRKDVATYGTIAWSLAAVSLEFQWWWRADTYIHKQHAFEMRNDGYFFNSSYGVDKLGHMYGSYLIFHLTYDFLKWADFDEGTAFWTAVAVPATHAVAIEIGDGFSKYWFSFSDLYFNSAGIVYAALQTKYPYLNNFNYKWSYYPSASGGNKDPDWGPASDYSGHIYWISMDVHNLLPEPAQQYWPKYLNVALGLGAKNVSYADKGLKKHKFAIALDWNTTTILPDGDTWGIFKNLINKIHLPAPGVLFYQREKPKAKLLLLN